MQQRSFLFLLAIILLAACRPTSGQAVVFSVTVSPSPQTVTQSRAVTLVPTLNRQPSRTPTDTPTPTSTPTLIPTNTPRATFTEPPTATTERTAIPLNTPVPNTTDTPDGTPTATWTPPPPDPATQINDHYHMARPIADGNTNWVDRTYPYGGTQGGTLQTHHGVEFINPRGTPVLAAAGGTVFYAGDDLTTTFGPTTSYYGRLVVIQHNFQSPEGQPVFSLYGHLDRWDVETGQQVEQGDVIGVVGATGVAYGPHLHFEVRVGDPHSFSATRNPELWIYPFFKFGTLAGIVTDSAGNRLYNVPIQVRSAQLTRYAFSYADDTVSSDPAFGENFTLGDLPANYYEVSVTADGQVRFRKLIYIYPDRTTWLEIQLD